MYNNGVFIYTLFCSKGKALGFFMLQNVVGVFIALFFFFAWRKYMTFKIIVGWNFTFPVEQCSLRHGGISHLTKLAYALKYQSSD